MRPVLKSALRPLWRDAATAQLRVDPEHAVVLSGLRPAEARLLAGLDGSVDTAAPDPEAGPGRVRRLLELLIRAEVVDDAGGPASPLRSWPAEALQRLAPDLAALALLAPGRTDGGHAVLAARSGRRVRVEGAGRIGAAVARLLAAAGVGAVSVEDPTRVRRSDLAPGGFAEELLGFERGRAAQLLADAESPRPRLRPEGPADLVVLAPERHPDPRSAENLVRAGTPHVCVVMRETAVVVGPLVLPGDTACLRCLDLHRSDLDPGWPAVVAQILGGGPPLPACDTVLSALGAAATAAAVLAHLDGAVDGPLRDATVEYALPWGVSRRRRWSAHPLCGCRWDA